MKQCIWSPSLTMLHQLELFQYKVLRWITNCSSYVSGLQSQDASSVLLPDQR